MLVWIMRQKRKRNKNQQKVIRLPEVLEKESTDITIRIDGRIITLKPYQKYLINKGRILLTLNPDYVRNPGKYAHS